VSTSVVKWSVVSVVKVLVIMCLTLLKIYRSYEVAAYMVFSFITLFHNLLVPFFYHCFVCFCLIL